MPRAVIDLGTNTFKLLVAQRSEEGGLQVIFEEERSVFLGKGGTMKAVLVEDAMDRARIVLADLTEKARTYPIREIIGIGTSALRNATNSGDLLHAMESEFDIHIRVVTGDQEAELILDGVRLAVPLGDRPDLIMDIGGGSIEFILATSKALMWKQSFDLGSTRLLERFAPSDPIAVDDEFRIAAYIDAQLRPLWTILDRHRPHRLIGTAGCFESLAHMINAEKHGTTLEDQRVFSMDAMDVLAIKDVLLRSDRAARSNLPGLPIHRVDTIPVAMIAVDRVLAVGGIRDLCWSRYAMKEGAAWRMLSDQE